MKTNRTKVKTREGARVFALSGIAAAMFGMPWQAGAQAGPEAAVMAKPAAAAAASAKPGAAAPMQMTISMAAPAAPASAESRGPNCTGSIREERTVEVAIGKSSLIPLPEPVRNRTLGNPNVVQATMVSPQQLYVVGRSVGSTNMILQGRSGSCSVVNVVVNADAGGLQTSLAQLLPGETQIRVRTAADNLVLSGSVSSAQAAQQALEIARAYANSGQGDDKRGGVLNMLSVDTPQQVMLEVKVAEVSKTLLNQLGSAVNLQGGFGSWTGGVATALLTGAATTLFASKSNKLPFQAQLDAQKNDSLVKVLAEPNLVTISGQEASFLAGGKIYIPVAQSTAGGIPTITLQEEEFGVGLKFTPTVLANGRINLRVSPEVSELSPTGATVSSAGFNGQTILPLITTRRASTTVQMRDGESFAIGGLLQDNARGTLKALPGAGEIPVLGALFRSSTYQQDLTELVFVITPHLVQPMTTASYPLPTDSFGRPNELSTFFLGNMEGSPDSAAIQRRTGAPAAAPAPAPAPTQGPAPIMTPAPAPAPAPANSATPAIVPRAAKGPEPVPTLPAPQPLAAPAAAVPRPSDDTSARIARIEATAARLERERTAKAAHLGAAADTTAKAN